MKQGLMNLLRRGQNPLLVALGFLPVPLLVTAYVVPEFLPYVWVWPLAYILLDVLGTQIRGKWRILYVLAQLAIIAGITLLMGIPPKDISVYLLAVMYLVLLLIELPFSGDDRASHMHLLKYVVVGVLAHLVAQFLISYNRRYGNLALEPVASWLTGIFFLFIVMGLLMLNGANLTFLSRGRQSVSKAMKRKNALLTLAVLAIAVLIALVPGVVSGLQAFFRWLPNAVRTLLSHINLDWFKGKNTGGGADLSELDSVAPQEVHSTPQWLEKVLSVFVIILACAAILYGIYFLVRKLMVFIRFLSEKLQKYMHAVSEDYIDVITDTRDEDDQNVTREKKQKKLSASEVRKLTPAGRVRYRYWLLMRKHPEWAKGSTARENLNAAAANVYERVRYSNYAVEEEDALKFAEETKKV